MTDGESARLEEIKTLLKSRRTEDRIRAVNRLARLPDPVKQPLLLAALKDKSNYVASLAAEELGRCADLSAMAVMVEHFLSCSEDGLKRDPGCHVRANLAFAFGRLEYLGASEALRIGIRTVQIEPVGGVPFDTGAHLRANCALAMAQTHVPDALCDIAFLLFDMGRNRVGARPDAPIIRSETRKAAAQALARTGDIAARIPLALVLRFPGGMDVEVLQECMQAIVDLEDPRALEWLRPYLEHPDQDLAAYAALMIARTRAPEAPQLLHEATQRLFGNALRAVVLALTALRGEEGRAVLRRLLTDEREAVRLAIVDALADSYDAEDRACLQELAQDGSLTVRNAAQHALSA
ncbi:MAG TPA: HEAT repeat domain-containing protein [Chthonomonadaceae bacterium]|nr:HEAT repeat domain-containing protein [Chthonomonadaceae bacterium]